MQRGAAAVDAKCIPVPEGRAPLGFQPVDHALRVEAVEAKRTARLDDLGDQALLLVVDEVGAGQFPRQRRRADRRAAIHGESVRPVTGIVAHLHLSCLDVGTRTAIQTIMGHQLDWPRGGRPEVFAR